MTSAPEPGSATAHATEIAAAAPDAVTPSAVAARVAAPGSTAAARHERRDPATAAGGRGQGVLHRTQTRLEEDRWTIVGLIVAVQVLAIVVSLQMSAARFLVNEAIFAVHLAEVIAVCLYALIALVALLLWRAGRRRTAIQTLGLYLVVLTAQLVVYVLLLLVGMGGGGDHQPVGYLGDLVSVLALMVAIFTTWYWIIDAITPGGAFLFAQRPGGHHTPRLIDYVFLAFNTTATFGPTTESLVDPRAKVAMMLQTGLSIAVLVVLASRIVSRS